MKHIFNTRSMAAGAIVTLLLSTVTTAHHSWRKYHWSTTTGIVSLKVGDNVDSKWDAYLTEAVGDWNASVVLDLQKVTGGTSPATCDPIAGRIETCNAAYGANRWLGIAQIWIQGTSHIYQATTRVNDTYFNTATYNTPAWRRLVMCQEVGHDFGLDHQDERNGNANLGTCMDYTSDPDGAGGGSGSGLSNEHPNAHDFEQLISIYGHKDSTNTAGASPASGAAARPEAAEWGRLVRTSPDNRVQTYEREIGNGNRVITHVFWADPEGDAKRGRQ